MGRGLEDGTGDEELDAIGGPGLEILGRQRVRLRRPGTERVPLTPGPV